MKPNTLLLLTTVTACVLNVLANDCTSLNMCFDLDGNCVHVGNVFVHECTTYKCSKSSQGSTTWYRSDIIQQGCRDHTTDECVPAGHTLTHGCSTFECVLLNEKSMVYRTKSQMCEDSNGQCHAYGSIMDIIHNGQLIHGCTCTSPGTMAGSSYSCKSYTTQSSHNSLISETDQSGQSGHAHIAVYIYTEQHKCEALHMCTDHYGSCVAVGNTYTHQCQTYRCIATTADYKLELFEAGCHDTDSGTCIPVGKVLTWDCGTYECVLNDNILSLTLRSQLCKDANGGCREFGSKMDVIHNGRLLHGCTCSKTSVHTEAGTFQWSYQCSSHSYSYTEQHTCEANNMCTDHQDNCVAIGQTNQHKCQTFQCSATTQGDGLTLYKLGRVGTACEDAHGNCVVFGSKMDMVHNGNLMHDCTCTKAGTDSWAYSCQSHVYSSWEHSVEWRYSEKTYSTHTEHHTSTSGDAVQLESMHQLKPKDVMLTS